MRINTLNLRGDELFKKLLVLLLLTTPAFASVQTDQVYPINDWSKSLNSHISPYNLPENQGSVVQNLVINNRFGALAKRECMLTDLDFGSASINGLHRFYKSDDTSGTIATTGANLVLNNSGTALTIQDGLTSGAWWQFVTYNDKLIGTNGTDQPIKYDLHTDVTANTDGHRTATELCAELGAPFAELDTGTDLDSAKWYQYKMAFYDGTTYYYSTAVSNPILTGAAVYNIALTDIPLGLSGTTHRYIYRTSGEANQAALATATFYMCYAIANNTATTQADSVSDATLETDRAPDWATAAAGSVATPPTGKYLTIHEERLFIAGNSTYPSEIYWSDEFNPQHFIVTDYEKIRPNDGDKITALMVQLGLLRVLKTNTIQSFYTTASSAGNWSPSAPLTHIGCPAPYSVANTPYGIAYLGWNGIYLFNGQTSQLISDAVTPQIRDISATNIGEAVGFYHDNQYYLSYTSTASGSATNNRVLIYNFTRDAYVLDYKDINCFEAFSAGSDLGTLYSGSSTTDGYVFAHSGSSSLLTIRTKTDFADGTYDDTRVLKYDSDLTEYTDDEPILELAWDCTIDGWLTELQTKDADIDNIDEIGTEDTKDCIIDRPDTDGTWTSAVYKISADSLDKLYWNEDLGIYGDVTFQVRLGASSAACQSASWSTAVSDPSGSDVSGTSGNTYLQMRANLSTTDIDYTSNLLKRESYVIKLIYTKVGSAYETEILSKFTSGWLDFKVPNQRKLIRKIQVYYESDSTEDMTFNLKNQEGTIDRSFTIDLGVDPDDDPDDSYTGEGEDIVYTYYAPVDEDDLTGVNWQYQITEGGVDFWRIDKILLTYSTEESYD